MREPWLGGERVPGQDRLALELAQGRAPERVDAGQAVLDPPDVQQAVLEVDLIPAWPSDRERVQNGHRP